ncbi:ribonuclease H-like domain-containing protein [Tanacetum coccineum]
MVRGICSILPNSNLRWLKGSYLVKKKYYAYLIKDDDFTNCIARAIHNSFKIMKKLMEDLLPFEELKFNLFSVSQMCDKKNSVLFTDTACVVLSPDFKLSDENHVLLKVLRKDNMYSVDLKNVVPQGGLTCLFAKATPDESNLWHRRLGHVNFKTMNKLVRKPCKRFTFKTF